MTSLIRQYAPAAGTPSGGDAQFQALQLGSVKGGSATADALPRPHGSGSASTGYVSFVRASFSSRLVPHRGLRAWLKQ